MAEIDGKNELFHIIYICETGYYMLLVSLLLCHKKLYMFPFCT